MDVFLKNVGSSAESIRMQVNVMGDVTSSEMEWNEPFFRHCFDNTSKIVTWVSRQPVQPQHVVSRENLKKNLKISFSKQSRHVTARDIVT